jgi:predicted TPR repeat methyltransferase
MVWEFERSALDDILQKYYRHRKINHFDFACGTGRILGYIQKHAASSVGVDVSPNMVRVARENNINAQIIIADLTKEDVLEDKKYALITAFRFFPNAKPELRSKAFCVLKKHLIADGYLVFNNHLNERSLSMYIHKIFGRPVAGHRMSFEEVESLVEANEMEVVKTYHFSVIPGSGNRLLLPIWILKPIEIALNKLPFLQRLGSHAVYVCRKTPSRQDS